MNNISLSDVLYMYIPVNFKLKMYASCALKKNLSFFLSLDPYISWWTISSLWYHSPK